MAYEPNRHERCVDGWVKAMRKKPYDPNVFTPIAQEIIELAIQEAKDGNYTYVGGCHIQSALNKVKMKHSPDIFDYERNNN